VKINWELPEFRPGIWGAIDRLIGPGATKSEKNIQLYPPFLFASGVVAVGLNAGNDWSILQYVLIALLAVDMVGGAITNATSAAKRWFFREGEGFWQHISFIAIHLAQIVIFSWAFLGFDIWWIVGVYGMLMLSSVIILNTPLYLRRPVAATLYMVALLLSFYVFDSPPYLEWFLPFLFLKILVSHALREEPYQPE